MTVRLSPAEKRAAGRLSGWAFIALAAFLPLLFAWQTLPDAWRARGWEETSCSIEWSAVRIHKRPRNRADTYTVAVSYRYDTPAGAFTGQRHRFAFAAYDDRRDAEADVAKLPPGGRVPCYFDPREPAESVIDRSWDHGAPLTLAPSVLFLLLGAFLRWRCREPG